MTSSQGSTQPPPDSPRGDSEAPTSPPPEPDAPTLAIPVRVELPPETGARPGRDAARRPVSGRASGRYVIEEEIGRGGMAVVYRAFDRDLRRQVAMKVMLGRLGVRRELVERFVEEAQATAQLQHPGIVPVHEMGLDDDGKLYFTMKLVCGRTLAQVVEDARGGDPETAREFTRFRLLQAFVEVCRTVFYAHERGVIHRDLKPQNVMVGRYGEVQVMDWGLAKVIAGIEAARAAEPAPQPEPPGAEMSKRRADTEAGAVLGTPAYMAPEQAEGDPGMVGPLADVYALGATLYHLLTGRAPFEGRSLEEVLAKVVTLDPPPPRTLDPSIPRDIEAICLKAMAKLPGGRYESASVLAEDVFRFICGEPVLARPVSLLERAVKRVRKNRPFYGALAAAILILLSGAAAAGVRSANRRAEARRFVAEAERDVRQADAARSEAEAAASRGDAETVGARYKAAEQLYEKALGGYSTAIGRDPSNAPALAARDDVKERIARARRDLAALLVLDAHSSLYEYQGRKKQLPEVDARLEAASAHVRSWDPLEKKRALLEAQEEAAEYRRSIPEKYAEAVSLFHRALGFDPQNKEARDGLAELYWDRYLDAEARGARDEQRIYEKLLLDYADWARYEPLLQQGGKVSITSDPSGAEVYLFRYEERELRLLPLAVAPPGDRLVDPGEAGAVDRAGGAYPLAFSAANLLGRTPLEGVPVRRGSYLLVLREGGYRDTRYPLLIERDSTWEVTVVLYREGEIGERLVYVPSGPFPMGGDPQAWQPVPGGRRIEVPGFFIGRFEVTLGEYLEFLRDPQVGVRLGREGVDLRLVPREQQHARPLLRIGPDGALEGPPPDPRLPVRGISHEDAEAYCRWLTASERAGGRGNAGEYRLPTSEEWEKAARGVDGRTYPWGSRFDGSFAMTNFAREKAEGPEPVGAFPVDESPYGVRDLAGNVRELLSSRFLVNPFATGAQQAPEGTLYEGRGHSYYYAEVENYVRSASRWGYRSDSVRPYLGFRVARSVPRS